MKTSKEMQQNMLRVLLKYKFLESYVENIEKDKLTPSLNTFSSLLKYAKKINYLKMKQLKFACTQKIVSLGLDLGAFLGDDEASSKMGPGDVQSLETLPGDISLMILHLKNMFKE
mgnify:CR=1 FL=1